MEQKKYAKLSQLVDDTFTVSKAGGYKWKLWDVQSSQMLVSDDYVKGYSKKYTLETDKGSLDLGSGQLSSLLEAVYFAGRADINGVTFKVKSNGKQGMDIRYYFNAEKSAPKPTQDLNNQDLNSGWDDENFPQYEG